MTYGHLRADCLYTGINSGPNARYRVWEAFTFTFLSRDYQMATSRVSVLTVKRLSVPHPRDVSWRLSVRVTPHRDAVSHGDVHVARKKIVIVSQHRHSCTHNRQHGCQNPDSITLSSLRPARLVLRWVIFHGIGPPSSYVTRRSGQLSLQPSLD